MKQKDVLFWLWLADALGAASRDFRTLIELYENPYELFHAEEYELDAIKGISPKTRSALSNRDLEAASAILDACQRQNIHILTYADPLYPSALRAIKQPPIVLYYLGTLPDLNGRLSIGMVGTRRMSAYGLRSAYKIAYELASVDAVVVSGMASGIDGVSAAAAIAAKGQTIAVLGCGIDIVYPQHHKKLRDAIAAHGAVISEYPPATKPLRHHFPTRNRIISGLSQGTLVVEAGIGSGSLITAKEAVLQGKDVFAIPANVGSKGAEGTNGLLQDGANLVLDTSDILKRYEYVYAKTLRTERLTKAKEESAADLQYLQSLGVIELQGAQTEQPKNPPLRALTKEEQPKRSALRRESSVKAKTRQTAEEREPVKPTGAPKSEEAHSELTPVQLAILEAMPIDRAISADALANLDHPWGDVIAALTVLEIMGLVEKLPGALYTKI
ncbi:MAG: DNA-processing protein DprA [Clostridia bacterium]|nr:DNA-processing protein DprA [Clostridia bacterium]